MRLELARVRLRGIYALVAGGLLLVGIPLFVSAFLAPTGYIEATQAVSSARGFSPVVQWMPRHPGAAFAYRIVELAPFLLAFPLPRTLRRVLPAPKRRLSAVLAWSGQIGFACYAVALLVSLFTSSAAASSANLAAGAA